MVKLTPDLICSAAQYMNAVRDRELDLRGYKIPLLENLGATLDQFDTIDFSDNEIRKIDNVPLLPRLKCLFFNNNRICRIGENLDESLPKLDTLILTNNGLQELSDLEPLTCLSKTLTMLSLLHNPVAAKPNYRLFLIHKFSELRVLDFRKVKQKERDAAKALFKSRQGKDQLKEIRRKAKTFTPGETPAGGVGGGPKAAAGGGNAAGLTPEQVRSIKMAIAKAATLDEIERLNQMLRTGQIPSGEGVQLGGAPANRNSNGQDVEMDE